MTDQEQNEPFRVAIIGGGMGGATAAHFLRKQFGHQCAITLFEQSGRIGGRMRSATFAGRLYETGASIFHSQNHYMYQFAKQYGLEIVDESKSDGRIAFYDGFGKNAFNTLGGSSFSIPLRMLWHYGLDTVKIFWHTTSIIRAFSKIYRLQETGHCFTTTAHLLSALSADFVSMTTWSYDRWLTERLHIGDKMKNELAYALVSNNYCQNQNVHTFVGFLSLATITPKLLSVKDGNESVPVNLVADALASNPTGAPKEFVHAQVLTIESVPEKNAGYTLEYLEYGQNRLKRDEFDYVILAAPMHQEATIKAKNSITLPKYTYQRVDHSFFLGIFKDEAIGLKPGSYSSTQSVAILPTKQAYEGADKCPFRSFITPIAKEAAPNRVWIAFSEPHRNPDPLRSLAELFLQPPPAAAAEEAQRGSSENTLLIKWLAYPTYKPVENPLKDLGQFVLAPRLYYANAIENAGSCMEMAAIGGRNVALLVAADRRQNLKSGSEKRQTKEVLVDQFPIPPIKDH